MTTYAFTSAALNYLPKVRALFASLRRHHPEFKIVLALSDRVPEGYEFDHSLIDEVIPLEQADIPDTLSWAFSHAIVELSTAIKPFVLQQLLARDDCEGVFYFDPDMVLFSRVDDLIARFKTSNVILTPHQAKPETSLQNIIDNEICSLRHGIFNLGFVGTAPTAEGRRFAKWWGDRVYAFCRDDIPNGLFTDQKWIDFAPVFFDDVHIEKSPRHNVATWNLTTRRLSGSPEGGFFVDDQPLGFYHFTGFDSGAHRVMAKINAGGNDAVEALISWYEAQTENKSGAGNSGPPWAYARYTCGTLIEKNHRAIYRNRADLRRAFPNPFDSGDGTQGYLGWLKVQGILEYPDMDDKSGPPQKLRGALSPLEPLGEPLAVNRLQVNIPDQADVLVLGKLFWVSPSYRHHVARRLSEVMRDEGVRGIMRRLWRRVFSGRGLKVPHGLSV